MLSGFAQRVAEFEWVFVYPRAVWVCEPTVWSIGNYHMVMANDCDVSYHFNHRMFVSVDIHAFKLYLGIFVDCDF